MYVIVIKYVQLLCISVFFNNINCNEIFGLQNPDQQQLFRVSECVARCINTNDQSLKSCYYSCVEKIDEDRRSQDHKRDEALSRNVSETTEIDLICRGSYKMVLKIGQGHEMNVTSTKKKLYMIKIQEDELSNRERVIYLSDYPVVAIENLRPNTTFNLSATIFHENGTKIATPIQQIKTLLPYYMPEKISQLSVRRKFVDNSDFVDVKVSWVPGNDRTCFYDIFYYTTEDGSFPVYPIQIRDPSMLYEYEIKNLPINHKYEVGIRALNNINLTRESAIRWHEFNTSRCNAVHNLNLTACPPDPVTDLSANLTKTDVNKYEFALNVSWMPPSVVPDSYIIEITERSRKSQTFVVPGNSTEFYTELSLRHPNLVIYLAIYSASAGGNSHGYHMEVFPDIFVKKIDDSRGWYILFSVLAILFIVILCYHCWRSRKLSNKKLQDNMITVSHKNGQDCLLLNNYDKEISYWYSQFMKPIEDELEIGKSQIEIQEKLGEGAFGTVKKGRLRFNGTTVAIKMLKENPTKTEIEDFRHEIELMKSVDKHKNIVSIVGHFTRDFKEMMLLTEYCGKGNLLNFLRTTWKDIQLRPKMDGQCIFNKLYEEMQENPPSQVDRDEGFVENMGYELFECENFTHFDGLLLLYFALQVAFGMEYLANNKVVHRDLAARNVLVCDDLTLKISDFGLSRDVYEENFYRKTGDGKLPIKWLALESMTRQMYNVYTDVWSYGILLYEIFTLGNDPYPGIPTNKLLDFLKAGYRLEKPANCSDAVYNLMQSCWLENPNNRPDFNKIQEVLQRLIVETKSGVKEHVTVAVEEKIQYSENISSLISVESYLNPVA